MKRLFTWFTNRFSSQPPAPRRDLGRTGSFANKASALPNADLPHAPRAKPQPDIVELDPHFDGEVVDNGPGKNVLIRNRFVREDTGTHDTLKILDDSLIVTDEEAGIDPYNTGQFDRSKNWDKRFRN